MSNEQQSSKKNRESSIRWQGRTIEQFGYVLNLILGLSVAALGFGVSLISNEHFVRTGWQNCVFVTSLLFLMLSIAMAIWCIINRLRDFRATAETARKREDGMSPIELQPLRTLTKTLGEKTWILFWFQVGSFGLGMFLLCVVVVSIFAKNMGA